MKLISNARALLDEQRGWATICWVALCGLSGWAGPDIVALISGALR